MRRGSAADRFRSLCLEALTTFPIPHDCLEEREEAFGVLAGLHGTDLVLKGAKAPLENDKMGRKAWCRHVPDPHADPSICVLPV